MEAVPKRVTGAERGKQASRVEFTSLLTKESTLLFEWLTHFVRNLKIHDKTLSITKPPIANRHMIVLRQSIKNCSLRCFRAWKQSVNNNRQQLSVYCPFPSKNKNI